MERVPCHRCGKSVGDNRFFGFEPETDGPLKVSLTFCSVTCRTRWINQNPEVRS